MRQVPIASTTACLAVLILATPIPPVAAGPGPAPDVPVRVGGAPDLDACGGSGTVTGLDPQGDNFLSVRSGPGGRPYREVDRVRTGQFLAICEERGPWLGVVYAPLGDERTECGVGTPRPRRAAYAGPCRSGWVHGRYVGDRAG